MKDKKRVNLSYRKFKQIILNQNSVARKKQGKNSLLGD